ncbi:hypothetical protein EVAR_93991_1 [Eumeta japonica]|uniref:Uncharacterized protein n=1 Tax=Eumeta variegata TaxID=151549 RepID=A0A4C1TPC2_EUMVA|nr:hypothetical protein EVAR_93991_1 [Eumeta japonica]
MLFVRCSLDVEVDIGVPQSRRDNSTLDKVGLVPMGIPSLCPRGEQIRGRQLPSPAPLGTMFVPYKVGDSNLALKYSCYLSSAQSFPGTSFTLLFRCSQN